MPTYAYACKDCGHAFDIQQSFSDDSLTVCPACDGVLRKKFNSVGVVFKGSGFYRNDSRATTTTVDAGTASSSDSPAASSAASSKGTTTSESSTGTAPVPAKSTSGPAPSTSGTPAS